MIQPFRSNRLLQFLVAWLILLWIITAIYPLYPRDWLGFERNHYDRIVHFSFGLLLAYPFREILVHEAKVVSAWSYFLAVVGIMAFSSFYEVMEGVAAMIVSPELGSAYLGTQGDEWDAQKDSFLAFAGAIIAMLLNWWYFKVTGRETLAG